jgi:hypothetical protein
MLEAVGHPVAVNPDLPLREIAEQRGWEVMTFETLGWRIRVAGAALGAVALGGAGAAVATRRRSRRLSFRSWPPRNAR